MKLHILAIAMLTALAIPTIALAASCEGTETNPVSVAGPTNDPTYCTAVGRGAIASEDMTTATGHNARATAEGASAYGFNSDASGSGSTAMGRQTRASGQDSTAIGYGAFATAQQASAFGYLSRALGFNSVAMGPGAIVGASTNDAVALGSLSEATESMTVSVGRAQTLMWRRITNAAAGINDHDVVVVEQIKQVVGSLGGGANFNGGIYTPPSFVLSMGTYNNVNDALVALDNKPGGGQGPAGANGASAYQVATSNGFSGTEQEWLASLKGDTGAAGADGLNGVDGRDGIDGQDGEDGTGGTGTEGPQGPAGQDGSDGAQGEQGETGLAGRDGIDGMDGDSAYEVAVSEGFQGNKEEWLESLKGRDGKDGNSRYFRATGKEDGTDDAQVNADRAVAAGANSSVNAEGGTALGDGATVAAGATNSVALGANSVATEANTVSVGSEGHERRVTNVAPGRIAQGSTDAVNGGQLWELEDRWNDRFERTDKRIDGLGAQLGAMTQMVGAAAAGGGGRIGEVQLNAGIGFSGNQAALAIGWSTRLSPRVSLSGGLSFGTGNKPVAGMGISINLGR